MTAEERNLVRARCVLAQAWWLSLQVAVDGWSLEAELVVAGIALAWRDCGRPMGVS